MVPATVVMAGRRFMETSPSATSTPAVRRAAHAEVRWRWLACPIGRLPESSLVYQIRLGALLGKVNRHGFRKRDLHDQIWNTKALDGLTGVEDSGRVEKLLDPPL